MKGKTLVAWAACCMIGLGPMHVALGNGGPFVVQYPKGDPAAKGVLARLDPSLKPARETRLRVVNEDLTITFGRQRFGAPGQMPPVATVTAAYTIENPTDQPVEIDFGFPILRGIYVDPMSMMPRPAVSVTVDKTPAELTVISNSMIYGIIRGQARATIEASIAADPELAALVAAVRRARGLPTDDPSKAKVQQVAWKPSAPDAAPQPRRALEALLTDRRHWDPRDAALLVEYAGLDFGRMKVQPPDRWHSAWMLRGGEQETELLSSNLGLLAAIGEQKATQFFARLAGCFDPRAASTYEAIFEAWGGDVRERSLDLTTGQIRPREIDVRKASRKQPDDVRLLVGSSDPTIYARVDYLDTRAELSERERACCKRVLKNVPVVFTFAPMNLLHYQVTFPAGARRVVTVTYRQYAYHDTRSPGSYQLAYVVHPASLWDDFGPIHLEVQVPKDVPCRASVPLAAGVVVTSARSDAQGTEAMHVRQTVLDRPEQKTGELFVALDRAAWDTYAAADAPAVAAE